MIVDGQGFMVNKKVVAGLIGYDYDSLFIWE
jgi:hypothetical protein